MKEGESAINKLEEYATSMIKEGIPYGRSIEALIPYLEDRYKKEKVEGDSHEC